MEVFSLKDEDLTETAKALKCGAKILIERREEVRTIKNEKTAAVAVLPENFVFVTEPYKHQEHAFAQHFKVKVYSSLSIGFDLDDPEQYRFLVGEQHFFEKVNLNEVKTRYIDSNSWNSPYPAGR